MGLREWGGRDPGRAVVLSPDVGRVHQEASRLYDRAFICCACICRDPYFISVRVL
eukprot:GDKH01002197.1.p2 GENE.GDKH01002197.1~~GDKH01002197.1.p2  ORF type:complete len:55 (+),score=0.43 GDKH01002197.1:3-167(+)